jgi:hypothetical protein
MGEQHQRFEFALMKHWRRLLAGSVAIVISGCSLLLTFDTFGECRDGACLQATPNSDVDATSAAICSPRRWPERPATPDLAPEPTRAYALTALQFAANEADGGVSDYDLNQRCVCPGGVRGQGTCAREAGVFCDDPRTGADNQLAALFRNFTKFDDQASFLRDTEVIASIASGNFNLLVRIDDYNGTADDPQVTVALYNALRVDRDGGAPMDGSTEAGPPIPTFAPDERWVVERKSLKPAPSVAPLFFDSNAYVANGVLVALFPEFELGAMLKRIGRFRFRSTDVRVILTLPGDRTKPARGSLTGRISTREVLQIGGRVGWCPGGLEFVPLVDICRTADLNSQGDDKGAAPCDAISTNAQLDLVPTQLPVTFEEGQYTSSQCPDAACP